LKSRVFRPAGTVVEVGIITQGVKEMVTCYAKLPFKPVIAGFSIGETIDVVEFGQTQRVSRR
jgi:hypothetical protein